MDCGRDPCCRGRVGDRLDQPTELAERRAMKRTALALARARSLSGFTCFVLASALPPLPVYVGGQSLPLAPRSAPWPAPAPSPGAFVRSLMTPSVSKRSTVTTGETNSARSERERELQWLGSRDRSERMRPVLRREVPAQLHHNRMRCDRTRRRNHLRLCNLRICNRVCRPDAERGRGDNTCQTDDLEFTHCDCPFVSCESGLNLARKPPLACDRCHKMAETRRTASTGERQ
jgi:hypothetical protein